MASSNVSYYEKQKELQDTITNCEQQRMELDKLFRRALQADQTSSKMRAARLNAYWKKICEDEKRAKQRNEMLMREFERIDAHMAEMNARTQRLALVKRQYEDYIARTYPQWNDLMHGSTSTLEHSPSQQPVQQEEKSKQSSSDTQIQRESQKNVINTKREESYIQSPQPQKEIQKEQHTRSQERVQQQQSQPVEEIVEPGRPTQQHFVRPESSQEEDPHIVLRSFGNKAYTGPQIVQENVINTSEYANLPQPYIEGHDSESSSPGRETSPHIQQYQVQVHATERDKEVANSTNTVPIKDEEAEDTSEFGSEPDIPMGQSLGNTQIRVDANFKDEKPEDIKTKSKITGPIRAELTADGLQHLLGLVEADLEEAISFEGHYKSSWPNADTKANIIMAANVGMAAPPRVDAGQLSMVVLEQVTLIVRNLSEGTLLPHSLLEGDVTSLTANKLRQHLSPEAQVVWDALISHFVTLVRSRAMEPQELSAIFTPCMVADGRDSERGHSFIVHLLEDICGGEKVRAKSPPLLNQSGGQQWGKGISPKSTLEGSGSFIDDGTGRVPPLKFGSLLDKPMSDDESSYVNSSLPRDAVPLNETAAYKSMISGTASQLPSRQMSSGPEDTDDDVEKQVATAIATKPVTPITPRTRDPEEPSETSSQTATAHTASHVYVPTAMETKQPTNPLHSPKNKFQGVKISSDLDTDTEVDAGIFGSSRKPSDNYDFDFYD